MASMNSLPVIDLSPFYRGEEGDDEDSKNKRKMVVEEIRRACSEIGFFQVVNHDIPVEQMKETLDIYRRFFDLSYEEKLKSGSAAHSIVGYTRSPDLSKEGNEHFIMVSPDLGLNPYPETFPRFRQVLEEIYPNLVKVASLLESIINQSLGLPENCLQKYNNDRSHDFLIGLHYFPPAPGSGNNIGKSAHTDTNCITLLYQDHIGGLQVSKNGQWIPVPPTEGAIIVNIGDVLQVLSNDKFQSATHQVINTKGKDRYSYAFFYSLRRDRWLEPLPQLTGEIGEVAKFRGFALEEYAQLRLRDRKHPPARYEDITRIERYAINRDSSGDHGEKDVVQPNDAADHGSVDQKLSAST